MAEEKKEAQGEAGESPKGKKSSAKLIILVATVLVVLGGGGFAAYTFMLADPPEAAEAEAEVKPEETDLKSIIGTMYSLDPFLVNIDDEKETRFLKTSLTLELEEEAVTEELDSRIAQIRDIVLLLLSSKRFSEVRSLDGKYVLREEILDQINSILVTGHLKNVYFTEFVVQ